MLIDGVSYTVITPQPSGDREAERARARRDYEAAKQFADQTAHVDANTLEHDEATASPQSSTGEPLAAQPLAGQSLAAEYGQPQRSLQVLERISVAQVSVQRAISTYQDTQALDSMTAALDHDVLTGIDLYA